MVPIEIAKNFEYQRLAISRAGSADSSISVRWSACCAAGETVKSPGLVLRSAGLEARS